MEAALAIRSADTGAVNWFAFTSVVARAVPFHWTTASDAKPLPLMVSVNAAPPAVVEGGLNELRAGPGTMVRGAGGLDATPPEITVTEAVPDAAMRAAVTGAVSVFGLTKLVGKAVPFQLTMEAVV